MNIPISSSFAASSLALARVGASLKEAEMHFEAVRMNGCHGGKSSYNLFLLYHQHWDHHHLTIIIVICFISFARTGGGENGCTYKAGIKVATIEGSLHQYCLGL